ncbi:hypothetical protein ES707_06791 [subsurface metagenome]
MPISQESNRGKIPQRPTAGKRLKAGIVFLVIISVFVFFFAWANGWINISRFIDPCGFKQRFSLPCPTCGMTTAALAFVSGRIFEAFYIQPAAAVLCAVTGVIAVPAFLIAVFGLNCGFVDKTFARCKVRYIVLTIIVIILGGWAVTMARALAAGTGF